MKYFENSTIWRISNEYTASFNSISIKGAYSFCKYLHVNCNLNEKSDSCDIFIEEVKSIGVFRIPGFWRVEIIYCLIHWINYYFSCFSCCCTINPLKYFCWNTTFDFRKSETIISCMSRHCEFTIDWRSLEFLEWLLVIL